MNAEVHCGDPHSGVQFVKVNSYFTPVFDLAQYLKVSLNEQLVHATSLHQLQLAHKLACKWLESFVVLQGTATCCIFPAQLAPPSH